MIFSYFNFLKQLNMMFDICGWVLEWVMKDLNMGFGDKCVDGQHLFMSNIKHPPPVNYERFLTVGS